MATTKILTRQDIENIKVGDVLPNIFGQMKPVTRVYGRGENEKTGMAFVCTYQQFGPTSEMSHSFSEGQTILVQE